MSSKIRKGIAISNLLILTGALLFAGLMGTLYTNSPLTEAMLQGVGLVEEQTDYTVTISDKGDTSAEKKFSDLAELSFDRASDNGCADGGTVQTQNEEGGYPGLANSYLTETPECWGANSTLVRGLDASETVGPGSDQGSDMEGIYSRLQFEISDDLDDGNVRFKTSPTGDSDLWIENNLLVPVNEPYENRVPKECDETLASKAADTLLELTGESIGPAEDIADKVASRLGWDDPNLGIAHIGTPNYILYFEQEVSNERATEWISNELPDGTYCGYAVTEISELNMNAPVEDVYKKSKLINDGKSVTMVLCPGDKGYVQVNKDHPYVEGEADEGWIDDKAWKFPRIVVTERGDECAAYGDLSSNMNDVSVEHTESGAGDLTGDNILWETSGTNDNSIEVNVRLTLYDENGDRALRRNFDVESGSDFSDSMSTNGFDFVGADASLFDGNNADDSDYAYRIVLEVAPADSTDNYVEFHEEEASSSEVTECSETTLRGCQY